MNHRLETNEDSLESELVRFYKKGAKKQVTLHTTRSSLLAIRNNVIIKKSLHSPFSYPSSIDIYFKTIYYRPHITIDFYILTPIIKTIIR